MLIDEKIDDNFRSPKKTAPSEVRPFYILFF